MGLAIQVVRVCERMAVDVGWCDLHADVCGVRVCVR